MRSSEVTLISTAVQSSVRVVVKMSTRSSFIEKLASAALSVCHARADTQRQLGALF